MEYPKEVCPMSLVCVAPLEIEAGFLLFGYGSTDGLALVLERLYNEGDGVVGFRIQYLDEMGECGFTFMGANAGVQRVLVPTVSVLSKFEG